MTLKLIKQEVGSWPMNMYVLICEATQTSVIIDPGADSEKILALVENTVIDKIILTHGHADHVGALQEIKAATGAPIYCSLLEAEKFKLTFDVELNHGDMIAVGEEQVKLIHTPGHTPGMMCLDLGDGRIIVGDTVFVGGPGRTWSPEDFTTTIKTMQEIVFQWPDETTFYPGHGPNGIIGEERPAFEAFIEKGWAKDTQGDVSWA